MGCNGWNHLPGCACGWGGVNYGRAATPARPRLALSTVRQVWRSFVNPNARCPVCRAPVFYYQSENGGRVFFDRLGRPWPKHPCTDQSAWRWPIDTVFIKEGGVREPSNPPGWQREGWVPVARFERTDGRPTQKIKDILTGAIVWSAADGSLLKVLWLLGSSFNFNWNGPVMMRPHPRSSYLLEFETIQLDGDAVRVQRLVAVKNDPLTTVTTLLSRLRDGR
jgi:hypothetical protein